MGRRGYPPEFRRKVLDLVASGRRVSEVACDLEISDQTIYSWLWQDRIDRGLGSAGRTCSPPCRRARPAPRRRWSRTLLVPGQATFARLMVEARLMTLRSSGSVTWPFR
ncbi:transposase, partial [Blastococcus mobilis]|uniref:transposase n=1 Tax=Blastococcus mobilis TaxID=1938746 RepID=UPI001595C262